MGTVELAVNGGLMRGMAGHQVLAHADGARFVREDATAPEYRLWSIDDVHPAMMRAREGGASIALEVWSLTPVGFVSVLQQEPQGLEEEHGAVRPHS